MAGGAGSAGTSGSGCSAVPPPLLPATLPGAVVGEAYSQRLMIAGAVASQVSWTVQGELRAGLSLTADDAEPSSAPSEAYATLSGTPVMAGTLRFGVSVGLIVPPVMCGAPPAEREYEFVVSEGPDADAGAHDGGHAAVSERCGSCMKLRYSTSASSAILRGSTRSATTRSSTNDRSCFHSRSMA
jgi:hypothetical protein